MISRLASGCFRGSTDTSGKPNTSSRSTPLSSPVDKPILKSALALATDSLIHLELRTGSEMETLSYS